MREYEFQKDPCLQKVIKNILHTISLDDWHFNGWINASDNNFGALGFELTFSCKEKEQINISVQGGITVNKDDVEWIIFDFERKSRWNAQTNLHCFISIDDDVEHVLRDVQDIVKCQPEYYQLFSERQLLKKFGTSVYVDKYLKKIKNKWEYTLDDENLNVEDVLLASCKNIIDDDVALKVNFFEDTFYDDLEICSRRWGTINIGLDDEAIRPKILRNICSKLNGNVSHFLDVIEESLEPTGYMIESHDFLIRTTRYFCAEYGHHLERICAIINVLTPTGIESVEAEAMYCAECNEYYISENEFNRIKRYGTLCHKVVTVTEYLKVKHNFDSWADKSFLSSYGYSANEQDDLSDAERQRILAFIIENDIASESRVISFLEWLIRKRGDRCYKACEKWERDVKFVRSYIPDGRYVIAKDIYNTNQVLPF